MANVANVIEGLAAWLDAEGLADYKTTGYGPADRAVTFKRLPATPDQAVAITPYGIDEPTVLPGQYIRVQLRFRGPVGDRLLVDRWADEVVSRLHWKHNIDLGGVMVRRSRRLNGVALGEDESGREERADNYEFLL